MTVINISTPTDLIKLLIKHTELKYLYPVQARWELKGLKSLAFTKFAITKMSDNEFMELVRDYLYEKYQRINDFELSREELIEDFKNISEEFLSLYMTDNVNQMYKDFLNGEIVLDGNNIKVTDFDSILKIMGTKAFLETPEGRKIGKDSDKMKFIESLEPYNIGIDGEFSFIYLESIYDQIPLVYDKFPYVMKSQFSYLLKTSFLNEQLYLDAIRKSLNKPLFKKYYDDYGEYILEKLGELTKDGKDANISRNNELISKALDTLLKQSFKPEYNLLFDGNFKDSNIYTLNKEILNLIKNNYGTELQITANEFFKRNPNVNAIDNQLLLNYIFTDLKDLIHKVIYKIDVTAIPDNALTISNSYLNKYGKIIERDSMFLAFRVGEKRYKYLQEITGRELPFERAKKPLIDNYLKQYDLQVKYAVPKDIPSELVERMERIILVESLNRDIFKKYKVEVKYLKNVITIIMVAKNGKYNYVLEVSPYRISLTEVVSNKEVVIKPQDMRSKQQVFSVYDLIDTVNMLLGKSGLTPSQKTVMSESICRVYNKQYKDLNI